jgi:hypothetical protein
MKQRASRGPAKRADIARLAGSPLVARAKREAIVTLAHERGYVVNSAARSLRRQRTETITVVTPLGHEAGQSLTDPFFVEMLGYLAGSRVTIRRRRPCPPTSWCASLAAGCGPRARRWWLRARRCTP